MPGPWHYWGVILLPDPCWGYFEPPGTGLWGRLGLKHLPWLLAWEAGPPEVSQCPELILMFSFPEDSPEPPGPVLRRDMLSPCRQRGETRVLLGGLLTTPLWGRGRGTPAHQEVGCCQGTLPAAAPLDPVPRPLCAARTGTVCKACQGPAENHNLHHTRAHDRKDSRGTGTESPGTLHCPPDWQVAGEAETGRSSPAAAQAPTLQGAASVLPR